MSQENVELVKSFTSQFEAGDRGVKQLRGLSTMRPWVTCDRRQASVGSAD
jgi:hypothetical protein